ncbi:TOG array regulator of axonemal microtubules protein 1 [Solanum pennellii]|uniref:TOG array regulator of axonemal microtubules protein 1 n=1 Tax=Solanum pennellii TaxID=28526 RepID=A0ABM1FV91_SOLPN|nr:TOG array regulator of axonemal microtubules protein 1 [Solanum pennellii]
MALRSLDNALPIAIERPKKQAKVVVTQNQKQTDCVVNDENKAPLPPGDAAVDYVPSENLEAIDDPDSKIHGLVGGLESKDWLEICRSLNDTRRFALFHSALLLPILDEVLLVIVKSMKNPRSALCKTSVMASADIFKAFGDELFESSTSDAFDNVILQLLLKASQDKKFVCEEADKTLKAMVESMTPLPLFHKLHTYVKHSNMRIRAKAAISISHCVSKMELDRMKEFGFVSLVQMAVNLLNDRLPEAREAARSIVVSVYEALTKDEEQKQEAWQDFCQSNLPAIHAQAIVKVVSS